jgi:ATP-binding protein involved in chromosome partitioning
VPAAVDEAALRSALATVNDPELGKPITELNMVESLTVSADGAVTVRVLLTVPGCPMKDRISTDVTAALHRVAGVSAVGVQFAVMSEQQRTELRQRLRGDAAENEIPFAQPGSRTRVYAVASGKGGVGKSSVTVNLAAALAERGLSVGVVDADIYGFSIPRMIGCTGRPTQVEKMIMPPQSENGVKVISIGMFTPGNTAVVWRGPMLHRALRQFLADVYCGELDVLLMDLPPGTGDIAISVSQLVPSAELLIVTTPQLAAREVAERAGSIAVQTHQQIVGVVENMSWLALPDGTRMEVFGSGGGQAVADSLSALTGTRVPLLGQIPLDTAVREGGDSGRPVVLTKPEPPKFDPDAT